MRVTEKEVAGYAWCTFSPAKGVICDPDPEQDGQHLQHSVVLIETTTEFTFRDGWGTKATGDPFDAAIGEQVEKSVAHLRFAHEADIACPLCGTARSCSTQLRPVYDSVSGQAQDELLRRLRREDREAATLGRDATDRQTAALEQANELKERELGLRERELELREGERPRRKAPA